MDTKLAGRALDRGFETLAPASTQIPAEAIEGLSRITSWLPF